LQSELVASHADVERLQTSLDALRAAPAAPDRTRELSESLERLRIESESFKTSYEEERVLREEEERRREEEARRREEAEERERHWREKFAREEDVARELGEVLEEFQNGESHARGARCIAPVLAARREAASPACQG
jgi:chromosome segregation ATPase